MWYNDIDLKSMIRNGIRNISDRIRDTIKNGGGVTKFKCKETMGFNNITHICHLNNKAKFC